MELIQLVYPHGLPEEPPTEMIINMQCADGQVRPYHLRFDPYEYELHRTGQLDSSYVRASFTERDISFLREMNITLHPSNHQEPEIEDE